MQPRMSAPLVVCEYTLDAGRIYSLGDRFLSSEGAQEPCSAGVIRIVGVSGTLSRGLEFSYSRLVLVASEVAVRGSKPCLVSSADGMDMPMGIGRSFGDKSWSSSKPEKIRDVTLLRCEG